MGYTTGQSIQTSSSFVSGSYGGYSGGIYSPNYQNGSDISFISLLVGLVGFILFILGLALPSPSKTEAVTKRTETEIKTQSNEALKELKMRYAKGEVTKTQFDRMKKDLSD